MSIDQRLKTPESSLLARSFLTLKTEDEVLEFLVDLLTIPELKSLSQRITVAKMLSEGYHYTEIASATGASSATISRVKRFLDYGADGYHRVLGRSL